MATLNFYWLQNTPNKLCSFLASIQHYIPTVFKAKGVRVKSPGLLYTIKAKLENMCGSGTWLKKLGSLGRIIFLV